MFKKILAASMASLLIFSLAGCSSGGGATQESTTASAQAETQAEQSKAAEKESPAAEMAGGDVNGDGKIVVGYISKNLTDPFHAPINAYAETTLGGLKSSGKINDWTGILDGETDPNKQIDRADECITKGCDYVIILPAEAEASDPAVTKLADAGIKVIVVNSKTVSTDDKAVAYCGSDDVEAGRMLADWVIKNVPDGGKYIHCTGVLGNSAQIDRGKGIAEVMANHPEFEMVGEPDTQWSGDKAANATTDAIAQYGEELVAVICDNDDMSSAAQRAANDAGRKDIVCVGVDGNQNPLQMVKDGELGATILQDGVGQIDAGINVIISSIEGKEFDKMPDIPFVLVTKDNVDQYLK
ncbi:MAG: substrate-binding domain-containing protein [Johnsonella sp.]|nr:substrate-binding domain-containing protein [Johnsonella sp.]